MKFLDLAAPLAYLPPKKVNLTILTFDVITETAVLFLEVS